MHQYFVYILSNKRNNVLYIGVTNHILRRLSEHKFGKISGFSKKYKLNKLVYYEMTNDIHIALSREKELKRWRRSWKIALINKRNSGWVDLYPKLFKFFD
jgi:putative endonuclease